MYYHIENRNGHEGRINCANCSLNLQLQDNSRQIKRAKKTNEAIVNRKERKDKGQQWRDGDELNDRVFQMAIGDRFQKGQNNGKLLMTWDRFPQTAPRTLSHKQQQEGYGSIRKKSNSCRYSDQFNGQWQETPFRSQNSAPVNSLQQQETLRKICKQLNFVVPQLQNTQIISNEEALNEFNSTFNEGKSHIQMNASVQQKGFKHQLTKCTCQMLSNHKNQKVQLANSTQIQQYDFRKFKKPILNFQEKQYQMEDDESIQQMNKNRVKLRKHDSSKQFASIHSLSRGQIEKVENYEQKFRNITNILQDQNRNLKDQNEYMLKVARKMKIKDHQQSALIKSQSRIIDKLIKQRDHIMQKCLQLQKIIDNHDQNCIHCTDLAFQSNFQSANAHTLDYNQKPTEFKEQQKNQQRVRKSQKLENSNNKVSHLRSSCGSPYQVNESNHFSNVSQSSNDLLMYIESTPKFSSRKRQVESEQQTKATNIDHNLFNDSYGYTQKITEEKEQQNYQSYDNRNNKQQHNIYSQQFAAVHHETIEELDQKFQELMKQYRESRNVASRNQCLQVAKRIKEIKQREKQKQKTKKWKSHSQNMHMVKQRKTSTNFMGREQYRSSALWGSMNKTLMMPARENIR